MAAVTSRVVVEVEAQGSAAEGYLQRFENWRGTKFLRDTLTAAGFEGKFVYRLVEWFKTSGFTKPVQPRKFDNNGVYLWLKPGGNGSGIKGVLIPDKGTHTTEEVYRRLKAYVDAKPPAAEEETPLDDATLELLLLAVNEANTSFHKSQDDFDTAAIAALRACSFETDSDTLDRMLEAAKRRGFVLYTEKAAAITPAGRAWLDDPARHPPAAAPAPPAPPADVPAPPAPADAIALIEANRAKLLRLLELPKIVGECRATQAELRDQIAGLTAKLDAEELRELTLLSEIDDAALGALLKGTV